MAGTPLILRIRSKKGMSKLQNLTANSTLSDLKKAISDLTNIQYSLIKILKGYPPKILENLNENVTLSSLYFRDGDLLTIEESTTAANPSTTPLPPSASLQLPKAATAAANKTTTITSASKLTDTPQAASSTKSVETKNLLNQYESNGVLLRKVVPANNSCLFTSVNYVVEDGVLDLDCQKFMRELIAQTVKSDPNTFNEGVLGKKNNEYCNWILNTTTWGGQIEVSILSKFYQIEICVVDIQTCRIDRFGEDCNYPQRVFIIYDGIHFDPLYLQPFNQDLPIKTKFLTNDESIMHQALEIANEAKKAREYTDVLNLKLRCLSCQKGLAGQKEAQEHAQLTGHINFGEF